MESSWQDRFGGVQRLVGTRAAARLAVGHVCVVGIGGVGSWAVEALARTGIGTLTLVDLDDVCVSNTNRQLHALSGTIGRTKVAVMAERALQIHPGVVVHAVADFVTASNLEDVISPTVDVVIDCIDDVPNKVRLLALCHRRGQSVVTTGGAGGRIDPMALRRDDLSRSGGDGLLREVRRRLRQEHGLAAQPAVWGIPAIFSQEPQRWPGADGEPCATRPDATGGVMDCATGFGTAAWVTGSMGLMVAAAAVDLLVAP